MPQSSGYALRRRAAAGKATLTGAMDKTRSKNWSCLPHRGINSELGILAGLTALSGSRCPAVMLTGHIANNVTEYAGYCYHRGRPI